MNEQSPIDSSGRFAPEEELVVRAAQTDVDSPDELLAVAERVEDWQTVLDQTQRHGVVPSVSGALSVHCTDHVPEDVLGTLKAERQKTAAYNLRLAQELVEVLDLLDEAGFDVIPYRGPVLANDAYGDVGTRQFGDLDLLVRQEEISDIRRVLEERGYEPSYLRPSTDELTAGQEWAYTHFRRDYAFVREETETMIELHWRVVDLKFPTAIELGSVWNRREMTTLAGREVPVLSPEDRLLMLCVHGSRHCWERLSWVRDVCEFLEAETVDWEVVAERAGAQNAERMFLSGPLLAHELYGIELPEQIHGLIEDDTALSRLRGDVLGRLFEVGELGDVELQLAQLRTLDRRLDRVRLVLYWSCNPTRRSIEALPVSRTLGFLFVLNRPLQLLRITLSKSLKPGD